MVSLTKDFREKQIKKTETDDEKTNASKPQLKKIKKSNMLDMAPLLCAAK